MYFYTSRVMLTLLNFIFGLLELILLTRVVLELFAANPTTPFVAWMYTLSSSVLYPFRGIFPSPQLTGGFILDLPAIVAVLAYTLIAYFISELIKFIDYHSTHYKSSEQIRR